MMIFWIFITSQDSGDVVESVVFQKHKARELQPAVLISTERRKVLRSQ